MLLEYFDEFFELLRMGFLLKTSAFPREILGQLLSSSYLLPQRCLRSVKAEAGDFSPIFNPPLTILKAFAFKQNPALNVVLSAFSKI